MSQLTVLPYIFDLELSGKCNTCCTFCPRDEMKRGEKYMSKETFENFFERFARYAKLLENREVYLPHEKGKAQIGAGMSSPVRVILCGMGESLMNPSAPDWIKRIRQETGVRVTVVTNGLLLKDKMVKRLIESDITVILVSVPGIDKETYTKYIPLDWDRVYPNIVRASEALPGRVQINATIPDDSPLTPDDVLAFWGKNNIPVASINHCHNRGGHLKNIGLTGKHGQSDNAFCGIIARHNFIAWDGRVLSCCHDLHADGVVGDVAKDEFLDIAVAKTPVVANGAYYKMCRNCNDIERCHAGQILTLPNTELPLVQLRAD